MLQYLDVVNVMNDTEAEGDTLSLKLCFDSLYFNRYVWIPDFTFIHAGCFEGQMRVSGPVKLEL